MSLRWPYVAFAILLAACERGTQPNDSESAASPPATDTPDVIDADWVASKLQAPPPPEPKNWAREIEKDPIAALKQMDPGALQPRRAAPAHPAPASMRAEAERTATYDSQAPLRDWPPTVGQFYPNIVLKDQDGQTTAIGDFRGKVVLIELVGLTCNGMDGQTAPLEEDVRDWARHFDLRTSENEYVLVGDSRFIGPETRRLIPGFHLVDRNGILRSMSSNDPRHDPLHSALLPKLAELVRGR